MSDSTPLPPLPPSPDAAPSGVSYPVYPAHTNYPVPDSDAPAPLDPHYGRVGVTPWTFRQTLIGTAITLVPWLLFVAIELSASQGAATTPKARLNPLVDLLTAVIFLGFTVITEGAFLLAPFWFAVRRRPQGVSVRDGLRALGFKKIHPSPIISWLIAIGWVILGLVIVFTVLLIYQVIIDVFHLSLQTNGAGLEQEATYAPFTVIAALIGAVFVAPFCEEIFFRGYMFAGFLRGMNVWLATIVSALLFALVHGDVGSFAPLLVIGLVLAVIRWRTGSIWPCMALHAANNATAAIFILGTVFQTLGH
ncbi:MAG: hypothetical protein OJF49_000509 [Ktedonobacterales bacterium]|nr:MAG: hypothetical protein OJF49_000509 [Ktedonobacterales bacterium]